jgi:hypothetical protein
MVNDCRFDARLTYELASCADGTTSVSAGVNDLARRGNLAVTASFMGFDSVNGNVAKQLKNNLILVESAQVKVAHNRGCSGGRYFNAKPRLIGKGEKLMIRRPADIAPSTVCLPHASGCKLIMRTVFRFLPASCWNGDTVTLVVLIWVTAPTKAPSPTVRYGSITKLTPGITTAMSFPFSVTFRRGGVVSSVTTLKVPNTGKPFRFVIPKGATATPKEGATSGWKLQSMTHKGNNWTAINVQVAVTQPRSAQEICAQDIKGTWVSENNTCVIKQGDCSQAVIIIGNGNTVNQGPITCTNTPTTPTCQFGGTFPNCNPAPCSVTNTCPTSTQFGFIVVSKTANVSVCPSFTISGVQSLSVCSGTSSSPVKVTAGTYSVSEACPSAPNSNTQWQCPGPQTVTVGANETKTVSFTNTLVCAPGTTGTAPNCSVPVTPHVQVTCTGPEEISGNASVLVKCDVSNNTGGSISLDAHSLDGNSYVSGINCFSQGGSPSCQGNGQFEFRVNGVNSGSTVLLTTVSVTATTNGASDSHNYTFKVDPKDGGF